MKFAVIGDNHYSKLRNYGKRDCLGAKKKLEDIVDILNKEKLDFIMSMGDVGNGDDLSEIPEMLEVYKKSVNPVKFVIGNHDLVLRTADEVSKMEGMASPFYEFELENYRFIVLNAFEQSRYCPEDSVEYKTYRAFRDSHKWLKVQEWPGIMTEKSWTRFEDMLRDSFGKGQNTVVFCHVPANGFGGKEPARLPEFKRMLDLIESYPNVRAYIAGHCHGGDTSVRRGILHKTVKSICDHDEPTACIVEADENKIDIRGIGAEGNYTHYFEEKPSFIRGTAPENSFVMTNCGDIVQVGADGKFEFEVPCRGMYSIKAVMDGCDDCYVPEIKAPADNVKIKFKANPKRKLYHGTTESYALLRITDSGKPVRWFDIMCNEYGAFEPDKRMWHEHSRNYWSKGKYAFTAEGEVEIREVPLHRNLCELGWYKGDLHAHLIHGENIYKGNVQQSAFIGRAEGYDWLYMAEEYGNDGYPTDTYAVAEKLSDDNFLYRLNQEFPKSRSNHFGTCGIDPVGETIDTTKISSLEIAQKYVWSKGGVTVPVHPFFGHMSFRELCLWVLCAPEKLPCIDFFYDDDFPKEMAENYWFMLLNRGYEIGCFATSDAAFDVGRTPGSDRGATYLYMEKLSEENIKKAIMEKRSVVTWDSAVALMNIDSYISGDKVAADGREHTFSVKLLWQADRNGTLRVIRNGKDVKRIPVEFHGDEQQFEWETSVSEVDNCWYAVILETDEGEIRSVASPIYFRNESFVAPKVIDFKGPFPEELLAECEELTPEQLAKPELLDGFAEKLLKYSEGNK